MPGYDKTRFVGVSKNDLEEFTCGICIEIFCDPIVTPCCRQTYCLECINEWLSGNNTCPNDRKLLTVNNLSPPPRVLTNLLNNMRIRCDFHANGCNKDIQLNSLSTHIKNCDFDPKKVCKTCGSKRDKEPIHDCAKNLLMLNRSLNDQIKKLVDQNTNLRLDLLQIRGESSNDSVSTL